MAQPGRGPMQYGLGRGPPTFQQNAAPAHGGGAMPFRPSGGAFAGNQAPPAAIGGPRGFAQYPQGGQQAGGYGQRGYASAPAAQPAYAQQSRYAAPAPPAQAFPHYQAHAAAPVATPAGGPPQPISSLTTFARGWTLECRVIKKGDIRSWNNSKGEGKLFSVDLMDSMGDSIRATFFRGGVDRFYDFLQEDGVYLFSGGTVKQSDSRYGSLFPLELNMDDSCNVVQTQDTGAIPLNSFNPTPIGQLSQLQKDSIIDILAVVSTVGDLSEIKTKSTGEPMNKREISLLDESGVAISLTLWRNRAETFNYPVGTVAMARGVQLKDFGGLSLSVLSGSSITFNPKNDQAQRLQRWWQTAGQLAIQQCPPQSLTRAVGTGGGAYSGPFPFKLISQISAERLGHTEGKTDFFAVRCVISHIKTETMWYPACPTPRCNRKLQQSGNMWICDKCNWGGAGCEYRYIVTATLNDATGSRTATIFNDTAESLFGGRNATLFQQQAALNANFTNEILHRSTFLPIVAKCRIGEDKRDASRGPQLVVMEISSTAYVKDASEMVEEIRSLLHA